MKIREMRPEDWNDVRRIYLEGIATGIATFQQSAPEYEDWDRGHLADCRLVAEEKGHILGWTALSATSSRPVYRGVVEVSLYVGADSRGKGVGKPDAGIDRPIRSQGLLDPDVLGLCGECRQPGPAQGLWIQGSGVPGKDRSGCRWKMA